MIDEFYTFEGFYHREPRSWPDFRHGMASMARQKARDQFDALNIARNAQDVTGEAFTAMQDRLSSAAGHNVTW